LREPTLECNYWRPYPEYKNRFVKSKKKGGEKVDQTIRELITECMGLEDERKGVLMPMLLLYY
jgi:hypothetical protein